MKSQIIAFALFTLTAAGVASYPPDQSIGATGKTPVDPHSNKRPRVEVVFCVGHDRQHERFDPSG